MTSTSPGNSSANWQALTDAAAAEADSANAKVQAKGGAGPATITPPKFNATRKAK